MPAVRAEMGPIPDGMTAKFDRGFVRLSVPGGWWGWNAAALPARFHELFRDGWVEEVVLRQAFNIPPEMLAFLRQVRQVDMSKATLTDRDLVAVASELRPGHDGARVQSVLVPRQFKQRYQELASAAVGGVVPGETTATAPIPTRTPCANRAR